MGVRLGLIARVGHIVLARARVSRGLIDTDLWLQFPTLICANMLFAMIFLYCSRRVQEVESAFINLDR